MTLMCNMPKITMAEIEGRCVRCDGCLLWRGPWESGPKIHVKRKAYKVRHLVWNLSHGRACKKSHLPMPTVCNEPHCVEPTHLTQVKRNRHWVGRKVPVHVRAKIADTKRATVGKIDMSIAEAIREPGAKLISSARAAGISVTNAQLIRANKAWIDYRNPFAQLMEAS
jgi:hypothetical protein